MDILILIFLYGNYCYLIYMIYIVKFEYCNEEMLNDSKMYFDMILYDMKFKYMYIETNNHITLVDIIVTTNELFIILFNVHT